MRTAFALILFALALLPSVSHAEESPTAIFRAIQANDLKALDAAIADSADALSSRSESGATPLLFATYLERETMVRRLQAAKPKLDFFEACVVGDLKTLRQALARGQSVNARSPDGFTALGLAVFFRQPTAARLLIDAGADLNAKAGNSLQVAPIHAAVARADIATLGLLLERGADPDLTQQKRMRPIHDAAASGNLAATAMLLMFGANAEAKSEDGNSPADLAQAKGHLDLARQLRQYVSRKTNTDSSPDS
jgi:uncharacterized protein